MTKEELIIGFFEKGYCCDLDEVKDTCLGLLKENQELKNQLEDKDNFINKLQATKGKLNKWDYENTMKQQKFIKYLEDEIKQNTPSLRWKHYDEDGFNDYDVENPSCIEVRPTDKIFKEILQKYRSIIRGNKDEK